MRTERDAIAQAELHSIVTQLQSQEWVPLPIPEELNAGFADTVARLFSLLDLLGPMVVAIMLATRMFWAGVRYGELRAAKGE